MMKSQPTFTKKLCIFGFIPISLILLICTPIMIFLMLKKAATINTLEAWLEFVIASLLHIGWGMGPLLGTISWVNSHWNWQEIFKLYKKLIKKGISKNLSS